MTAPRIFTVPAGNAFAEVLAAGLLRQAGDPLALSGMLLLLPNRRAVGAMTEAFLRLGDGAPRLLPRMLPLGDLDAEELLLEGGAAFGGDLELALAPAIGRILREALLSKLAAAWLKARGKCLPAAGAIGLARELARLIDEAETAEIDWQNLEDIVPQELAAHWQLSRDFLAIATRAWPEIERARGQLGPAARRRLLLDAQADLWRAKPPDHPVIAAGSTGSIPAVARLLEAVARLPRGQLVLPGLDQSCSQALWDAIGGDHSHPQHGLAKLLDRLKVAPKAVALWQEALPESALASFVNIALRPAKETASWRDLAIGAEAGQRRRWQEGLEALTRYDCADERQEAGLIALLLRRSLETPGKTAALVTPDRNLARRVAAELTRWGIEIDDSAGRPLLNSPPLTLLRALAKTLAEDFEPESLLTLLKHPLTQGRRTRLEMAGAARDLERFLLRGSRPDGGPDGGFAGLRRALRRRMREQPSLPAGMAGRLSELLAELEDLLAPPTEAETSAAGLLDAQLAVGERLAGPERLWAGEAGEAVAEALIELRAAAAELPPVSRRDYPELFERLLEGQVLRPGYRRHPRLHIWGPLEARLQSADLLILGSLNEGSWPRLPDPGPWLSRPMRRDLGLPPPERRIGQAAHDFVQGLGAAEAVLTRARKQEGTPTVPARWLSRLEALTGVLDLERAIARPNAEAAAWIAALDAPEQVAPCLPPAPRPPVPARPRQISVTDVETWMRNPYALFARRILKLEKLPELAEDPGPAERGQLIHAILEIFVKTYPQELPADPEEALAEVVERSLAAAGLPEALQRRWRPRLARLLGWYLALESERRPRLREVQAEVGGRLKVTDDFQLTARADRLEVGRDGKIALIDYKTGQLPSISDLERGLAPQLPLEGAIAEAGGFAGLPAADLASLEFWKLSGGRDAGECKPLSRKRLPDIATQAAHALDRLRDLIAVFDRPETPYLAHPRPGFRPRFDDYRHLSRLDEWAGAGGRTARDKTAEDKTAEDKTAEDKTE
ncbi:MAG: double-strand break repair protein AddB [Rhodospirillales bacterium]|nr:double-strand break repair protein AddB [Rhodospirillales bacterium]